IRGLRPAKVRESHSPFIFNGLGVTFNPGKWVIETLDVEITQLPNYKITQSKTGPNRYFIQQPINMLLEGTQKIFAPRDRVFQALIDPVVLQECIPGCQELEKTGEDQYKATLSAGDG